MGTGTKALFTEFVDIFLKRIYSDANFESGQTFYREALIWRQLRQRHILPFMGIDKTTFEASRLFCMVSPWMHCGTLLHHTKDNIGFSERLRLVRSTNY